MRAVQQAATVADARAEQIVSRERASAKAQHQQQSVGYIKIGSDIMAVEKKQHPPVQTIGARDGA